MPPCVSWHANIDESTEWQRYASGLGPFSLPLMCLVDPAKPGVALARWTGLISAKTFLHHLQGQTEKCLPLVITNLPPGPLDGASFVVRGIARANAVMGGTIPGASVERVLWRLNGTSLFQTADGTTNWSAQASLPHGTNVFESYVEYDGAQNSWTNRVTLINLGDGKCPLTITAEARTKSYGTALDLGTGAFSVAGLLPGDAVAAVTLTASGGIAAPDAVGEYWITPSAAVGACGTLDDKYTITYVANTLTVEKAVIAVTASDATKQAGAPNPVFTAGYAGFVNGEEASVLSGSPSLTTTATIESGPGDYPIEAALGTLQAPNYRFVFVPAHWHCQPAACRRRQPRWSGGSRGIECRSRQLLGDLTTLHQPHRHCGPNQLRFHRDELHVRSAIHHKPGRPRLAGSWRSLLPIHRPGRGRR